MIIFDLDKTLRTNDGGDIYIPEVQLASNWVDWQYHVNKHGKPIEKTVKLFNELSSLNDIIILTSSQFGTLEWLEDNNINVYKNNTIIERQINDNRSCFQYKKDFIDIHKDEITLWIDDNDEVCDYVRSLNILVIQIKE